MKTVNKDELFQNLSGFLKAKGIELKSGSYTQRIRSGCGFLADAVNATQKTVHRAKAKADQTLDQLRKSIHEATAPKPPPVAKSEPRAARPKPAKKSGVRRKSARK